MCVCVLCVCVHDVWGVSTWVLSPWLPRQARKYILPRPLNGVLSIGSPLCVFACVCMCVCELALSSC